MAGMQLDLEAIVREVMQRLQSELAAAEPAAATASDAPSPAKPDSRPATKSLPNTLQVQDRVVTLARLKDRLSGIREMDPYPA